MRGPHLFTTICCFYYKLHFVVCQYINHRFVVIIELQLIVDYNKNEVEILDTIILKKLLQQSGKTQKDVAKEIGLSQQRFNFYVTGKRQPDNEMLTKIAAYFHVSVDYLLGLTDDPTPPGEQIDHKKTHPSNLGERVLAVLMEKGIEPKIFCENLDALNEEQLKLILDNIKLLASKNHD